MDAEDGYKSLRGNKIQNLGDGLLVGAIPKHNTVDLGPGHQVAHVIDDAFRVSLVDQQCDHVDINRVLLAPQRPDVSIGDVARASEDHGNVQNWHFVWGGTSPLLLSRRGVHSKGHRHQESQGEQDTVTATAAAAAAPSTPPLTPFVAEEHTAKPLYPLHGERMVGKTEEKERRWER